MIPALIFKRRSREFDQQKIVGHAKDYLEPEQDLNQQ